MSSFKRNLIIVHTPPRQALADFEAIAALIAERAPEIEVFIVRNGGRHSVTRRRAAERPSLVFSPMPIEGFRPLRGKIYMSRRMSKFEENRRLAGAGVRVPEAIVLRPETVLDRSWGSYTVVKPNTFGRAGQGVRLMRTCDVRWVDPHAWPRNDPRYGRERLAQRFIDTGPFAVSHRVMTVFGRPIYSITTQSLTERPPIDPGVAFDIPIASNHGERALKMDDDREVVDFALGAATAFPELPVLGIDIVREAGTGKLYVLEVNTGGGTWHISSRYAEAQRRDFNLDLYGQFDAINTITDALIEVTRREAE
jgi:hypothetical protein